jgi:hypothetical protein
VGTLGTQHDVVGAEETIQDGALVVLAVRKLNLPRDVHLAPTRRGDVGVVQLIAIFCEVVRVIGRGVDKLLGEVRGVGLGGQDRLRRSHERVRLIEHGCRGHHGELSARPQKLSGGERHGRLLRRNVAQRRQRLTNRHRVGAKATRGHRVVRLVPDLVARRHGRQRGSYSGVPRKRRKLLGVARRLRRHAVRVVDRATLGRNMVRVRAPVVVLLSDRLDPVVGSVDLVIGSLDVEVAVDLVVLWRGKLPEIDKGTSPLHDEMDRLALVSDNEANVGLLDVELAGGLVLSHDGCDAGCESVLVTVEGVCGLYSTLRNRM